MSSPQWSYTQCTVKTRALLALLLIPLVFIFLSCLTSIALQLSGELSYNGYGLGEFVPQKTSAYVSQYDLHIPEMTVRETIDFSACCQGIGSRAGNL